MSGCHNLTGFDQASLRNAFRQLLLLQYDSDIDDAISSMAFNVESEIATLRQQVSGLQAREAQLVDRLKESDSCLCDLGSNKGGWAWEEVHDENQEALTTSTAPAWLAEHDAGVRNSALHEAVEVLRNLDEGGVLSEKTGYPEIRDAMIQDCVFVLVRMASEGFLIEERKAK